jgi:hypothetical protein
MANTGAARAECTFPPSRLPTLTTFTMLTALLLLNTCCTYRYTYFHLQHSLYSRHLQAVEYVWPSWLRAQTEKQRIIWGYKVLFLLPTSYFLLPTSYSYFLLTGYWLLLLTTGYWLLTTGY